MQLIAQLPTAHETVNRQDWSRIFAALVIVSVPVMVGCLRLQTQLDEGLSAGSRQQSGEPRTT